METQAATGISTWSLELWSDFFTLNKGCHIFVFFDFFFWFGSCSLSFLNGFHRFFDNLQGLSFIFQWFSFMFPWFSFIFHCFPYFLNVFYVFINDFHFTFHCVQWFTCFPSIAHRLLQLEETPKLKCCGSAFHMHVSFDSCTSPRSFWDSKEAAEQKSQVRTKAREQRKTRSQPIQ